MKKNQLAILVISLMLITAGYLNYQTGQNGEAIESGTTLENNENVNLASLGDAKLVNANIVEEKKEEPKPEEENNEKLDNKEKEIKQTNTNISGDDYFAKSKLERNVMYSQMTSRYQETIASTTGAPEQKAVAQEEINKINSMQNAIMIAENLLTSKGFAQNIIFVNGDSISIIIGKEKLEGEEVAQIQNIVSRELKADINNIHISMK